MESFKEGIGCASASAQQQTMDEQRKRKALESPGSRQSPSTLQPHKLTKLNPPETSSCSADSRGGKRGTQSSDLAEKLVAMWTGGSRGHPSLLAQDKVRESMALRESQQKVVEAENFIQKMQEKIKDAEIFANDLVNTLQKEERTKNQLIQKINATAEVVGTITEHINYITDTLGKCQRHKDHLAQLHDNTILEQRDRLDKMKNREEWLIQRIHKISNVAQSLNEQLKGAEISNKSKLCERDAQLATAIAQKDAMQEKLDLLVKEKQELSLMIAIGETSKLDFAKKIREYELEVKNLTVQLDKVCASLDTAKKEKSELHADLLSKNRDLTKIIEDLETAKATTDAKSAEISALHKAKKDLEQKLESKILECETLERNVRNSKALNDALSRESEKLKEQTGIEITEMKMKIETAEMENRQILEEAKKKSQEAENKYHLSMKAQVEKYETSIAEMKAQFEELEARHRSEISNLDTSSSIAVSNANTNNLRMEKQIEKLNRDKENCETKLRQVEDLLIKHTNSEINLKRKLDDCQSNLEKLQASTVAAAEYRQRQEENDREKSAKIADLEKELLNLKFSRTKSTRHESPRFEDSEDTENSNKDRGVGKKSAGATYQKPILKRLGAGRKTRTSPPSPISGPTKKLTFLDVSNDSVEKSIKPSNIPTFNSIDPFDEMVELGKSSSQPLQPLYTYSQASNSSQQQAGRKKFFKSRNSQAK